MKNRKYINVILLCTLVLVGCTNRPAGSEPLEQVHKETIGKQTEEAFELTLDLYNKKVAFF